jgi:formate hydrogenlyase subunit 3/multisubunit Na+/H+ antiporter MnhD subunit
MNPTHFHLLLNHFPIIGTLISAVLLMWGLYKKQLNIQKVSAVSFIAMALIAIPVYLTGEPAEESVERLPGISEALIELHEEAASVAIWVMELTALVSIAALFFSWQKNRIASSFFMFVMILSLLSFAAMARTGYLGGQIRHTELKSAGDVIPQPGNPDTNKKEKEDDD